MPQMEEISEYSLDLSKAEMTLALCQDTVDPENEYMWTLELAGGYTGFSVSITPAEAKVLMGMIGEAIEESGYTDEDWLAILEQRKRDKAAIKLLLGHTPCSP